MMNIYQQLGVEPIINACGSVTRLGGASMHPRVLDAFQQAAREWVPLERLQAVASTRIAGWTDTEAGLVTTGAAGALTLGAAAILTGHDLGRMERLPDCSGFAHEFIVSREQRSGYDHAIRAAGARLVEVGFNEIVANAGVRRTEAWEYDVAVTERTAGIFYSYAKDSRPALSEVVEVARRHGLPVLVDAAGELPPRSNLSAIASQGADLVAFSGGKAIRGPQSTGILCGRRSLISAAALQMLDMDEHQELWSPPPELVDRTAMTGIPRHGIGRGFKVSKEGIVALLTALDLFVSGAYDSEIEAMARRLETIAAAIRQVEGVCRSQEPTAADCWPRLEVLVGSSQQAFAMCRTLRQGSPPVYVGHGRLGEGILVIDPLCLDDDGARILAERLRKLLT